jgi:serine/threonine protein kinase
VQEYAANGDLFALLDSPDFNEARARRYMGHVISAVEHLHGLGIVHRDIKPDNVLLDHTDTAKLCDFGMADYHGAKVFSGRGTMPYMAPEIIQCRGELHADRTHDVWALGVTLFVLLTGLFPWGAAEPGDAEYEAFCRHEYHRLPAWKRFTPELAQFLQEHVFVAQQYRCSAAELRELLAFDWIKPTASKYDLPRPSSYHGMTTASRQPPRRPTKWLSSTASRLGIMGMGLVRDQPSSTSSLAAEAV